MRKVLLGVVLFSLVLSLVADAALAEVIDVNIKGVSDGIKSNKQQDYKKAVMNAKLQAIEQAGASVESITKVVNFQLKYDAVESKSKAILLPGFQVIDVGYTTDGTYNVVLVGKIQVGDKDSFDTGALRYAKSLYDRGQEDAAKTELEKLISTKDSESREGAMYYYGDLGFENINETLEKLKAWYPTGKYCARMTEKINSINKLKALIDPYLARDEQRNKMDYPYIYRMLRKDGAYSGSVHWSDSNGGGSRGDTYIEIKYSNKILTGKISQQSCWHAGGCGGNDRIKYNESIDLLF